MYMRTFAIGSALLFCFIFNIGEAKFERVGFISDPVKLLLQDSYSSLKNRMYQQKQQTEQIGWKKRPMRTIRKRKFTAFPSTFYSTYGFGADTRRSSISFPYTDLFFSG
ncbi:unnamed protein product [Caenorhabditis angaria]|uniref:Uncharacterized protein n=1 Tax=Caenorhabditis angaria TaxID=860376 RepID=A0A9P1I618_9PELO|nr:unnamed protein product [Caenorhabditis angaria]